VLSAFKSLFWLAGVVQGLTLPLVVFSTSLEAAGRYDQVYVIRVASLAVRVIAVIAVVRAGGGLFGVGAAVLLSQLLAYGAQVPLAIRANPGLSLRPKWVRKSVFQSMFRYGSISVTVGFAERLRGSIYPVMIAKFLTPVAVTIFSLPVRILSLPTEGIGTMTEIVNPVSSELEARNDFAKLRELILLSVQSAFLLLAPMAAFLFVCSFRSCHCLYFLTDQPDSCSAPSLQDLGIATPYVSCRRMSETVPCGASGSRCLRGATGLFRRGHLANLILGALRWRPCLFPDLVRDALWPSGAPRLASTGHIARL